MASSTANLGLRKPAVSENWSVQDDFNANMQKIDDKFGAVSGTVKENLDALNSNLTNKISILVVTESGVSLNAGEHKNISVTFTSPGNVQAVILLQSPNSAYIVGSTVSWSAGSATIGLYNTASSAVTGNLVIGVLYK